MASAGLGGFAQGLARGLGNLPQLLYQKQRDEEREAERGALRGMREEKFALNKQLMEGRLADQQSARELAENQRFATGIDAFLRAKDYEGAKRFSEQHAPIAQRLLSLPEHRQFRGLDIREGPEGMMFAPLIENAQTRSSGPHTDNAGVLPDDRVNAVNEQGFRASLSPYLPEESEQYEVVNDPYGRGGVGQRSSRTGRIVDYQGPTAAVEKYETVDDPFGRGGTAQRSTTTGKIVNYQAPKVAAGPASPQGKLLKDIESAKKEYGADSPQVSFLEGEKDAAKAGAIDFKSELAYAKEHEKRSKDFVAQSQGFGRVVEGAKLNTGQGDIAVVFGYMKTLDPGSTVREGEFATAEQTAGVPGWIRAQYNKALRGERLTEKQRQDFVSAATKFYGKADAKQRGTDAWFRKNAGEYGFEPDRVVENFIVPELSQLVGGGEEAKYQVSVKLGSGEQPTTIPSMDIDRVSRGPATAGLGPEPAVAAQQSGPPLGVNFAAMNVQEFDSQLGAIQADPSSFSQEQIDAVAAEWDRRNLLESEATAPPGPLLAPDAAPRETYAGGVGPDIREPTPARAPPYPGVGEDMTYPPAQPPRTAGPGVGPDIRDPVPPRPSGPGAGPGVGPDLRADIPPRVGGPEGGRDALLAEPATEEDVRAVAKATALVREGIANARNIPPVLRRRLDQLIQEGQYSQALKLLQGNVALDRDRGSYNASQLLAMLATTETR